MDHLSENLGNLLSQKRWSEHEDSTNWKTPPRPGIYKFIQRYTAHTHMYIHIDSYYTVTALIYIYILYIYIYMYVCILEIQSQISHLF